MPKFKRGNDCGFKARNVPHNKGVTSEQLQNSPGRYRRLPEEMDLMVRDCPSASEREEMLLRPDCYHLLRPRKLRAKDHKSCLDGNESEQQVKFSRDKYDRRLFFLIFLHLPHLNICYKVYYPKNDLKRVGFMYLKITCNYM